MKHYLIVGGSSGIGLALVKLLAEKDCKISVISRNAGDWSNSSNLSHYALDVSEEGFQLPGEISDPLDGLVYCPGSIVLKPFRSLKPAQFLADFELNVLGAVRVLQAALRQLKKAESASIVLFSTVAVQQGMPFHASIATAKGAIEGLTRSLAAELAPKIRVNAIAPSLVDTPLAEKLLSSPAKKEAAEQRHPLKRIGSSEELASLAAFLLGGQSSWMTGQIIGMDGGMGSLKT